MFGQFGRTGCFWLGLAWLTEKTAHELGFFAKIEHDACEYDCGQQGEYPASLTA